MKNKKKGASAGVNGLSADDAFERGSTLLHAGQPELALPYLERTVKLSPKNTEALDLLGEAHVDLGDYGKATQAFKQSVSLSPDEAGTKWMFLGQLSTGTSALQYYKRGFELLQLDSSNPNRLRELARAQVAIAELYLTDLCMEDGAEQACETAVALAEQLDPTSLEALQTKASMRLSQNRSDEAHDALKMVAKVLLETPLEQREAPFEFCVQTCRLLVECEDKLLAIRLLESLLREDDENVEIWILLGHCHLAADAEAAIECFERAEELLESFLKADPTDELFKAQLDHVRESLKQVEDVEMETS
jgi:tetratricopeptide (TPR) repeat protein